MDYPIKIGLFIDYHGLFMVLFLGWSQCVPRSLLDRPKECQNNVDEIIRILAIKDP